VFRVKVLSFNSLVQHVNRGDDHENDVHDDRWRWRRRRRRRRWRQVRAYKIRRRRTVAFHVSRYEHVPVTVAALRTRPWCVRVCVRSFVCPGETLCDIRSGGDPTTPLESELLFLCSSARVSTSRSENGLRQISVVRGYDNETITTGEMNVRFLSSVGAGGRTPVI